MRLFFGLNISNENKNKLKLLQDRFVCNGRKVNMSNLHLTLVFLGEVNEIEYNKIKECMKGFTNNSFNIKITKIKMLRDMVIGEIEDNQTLNQLQLRLSNQLTNIGLQLDNRKYYPHITLSRKSDLKINNEILLNEKVEEVILFESRFTDNGVIYIQKDKWSLE